MTNKPYRECVVAVFINADNHVLVARRASTDSWQFPQGGVEPGESFDIALRREMQEELGCDSFDVLKSSKDFIYYDFPKDLQAKIAQHFCGQKQFWYLCRFIENHGPDLDRASDKEFDALDWVSPKRALNSIVSWKKEAYKKGLNELGLT